MSAEGILTKLMKTAILATIIRTRSTFSRICQTRTSKIDMGKALDVLRRNRGSFTHAARREKSR
jgi:hypothetical protein